MPFLNYLTRPWPAFALSLIFMFLYVPTIWALEEMERLPSRVIKSNFSFSQGEEYDEVWGGSGKKQSLREYLIRDNRIRPYFEGTVTRQQSDFHWITDYALGENWQLRFDLPVIALKQTADVSTQYLNIWQLFRDNDLNFPELSLAQDHLDQFKNKNVSGLGDIQLQLAYAIEQSNRHLVFIGPTLGLPTGNSGESIGFMPIAVGDRQADIGLFLHWSYYPRISGLHSNLHLKYNVQLDGRREDISGNDHTYSGGNQTQFNYNLILERKNFLVALEYERRSGDSQHIGGRQQNDAYFVHQLQAWLGYGNLNSFEKDVSIIPFQVRLGYTNPILGLNVPFYTSWHVSAVTYF